MTTPPAPPASAAAAATPPSADSTAANSNSNNDGDSGVDAKIAADLQTVVDKMDLLANMLSRPGRHGADETTLSLSKSDDALLTIVGFLEACAPRLVELVEAASSGALSSETTLMKCLEVNDRLTKMLDDVDNAEWIGGGDDSGNSAAAAAAGAGPPPAPMSDSMLSADYSTSVPNVGSGAPPASSASLASASPAPTGDTPPPGASGGIQQTKSEDEFDDFFNERTTTTGTDK